MSLQVFSAHITLLCFTLLLSLKLDHIISYSWWIIFFPLFVFHAVVDRGSFSLSLPSVPHGHYVQWVPLLIAFEVLLCFFLETAFVRKFLSLKFVFLPLLAFELMILFDNLRMLKALLPGYDFYDAICEALPHFWVAISMVFFVAATLSILQKLCGDVHSLGWWDLFIIFAIAECFAFLAYITWSNPVIPILGSQILLLMRLEGRPVGARFIPLYAVFSPIFLAQGIGVISASNLVGKISSLLRTEAGTWRYVRYAASARDSSGFIHRCSRLLFWWSADERSREEEAFVFRNGSSRYNTFSGYPPEIVERIPKKNPTVEIWRLQAALNEQNRITESSRQSYERPQNNDMDLYLITLTVERLQAALNEQTEIAESSRQNYERPQNRLQAALDEQTEITESSHQDYESPPNEKVCTICYDHERNTMLLPCRHSLCNTCSKKCQICPICRGIIDQRMHESPPNEKVCTICYDHERNTMLLPCEHILCSTCSEKCQICPICRATIDERVHTFDV